MFSPGNHANFMFFVWNRAAPKVSYKTQITVVVIAKHTSVPEDISVTRVSTLFITALDRVLLIHVPA